jgi:hypothetical protein
MYTLPLLACLLGAGTPARETNFAENLSVEADNNRDGQPDGWLAQPSQSPAKLGWDDKISHSGRRSLRIADSWNPAGKDWKTTSGRWVLTTRSPVVPGEPYTLDVWIKTAGVTGRASACIVWWGGQKWLAESYTKPLSGTNDWQQLSVTAEAPAAATEAAIYLCLGQSKGTAWFDDIAMAHGRQLPDRYRPVDLAAACNAELDAATGPELADMPTGENRLRGVPFQVGAGRRCVFLQGVKKPAEATIAVDQDCQTLYFLHATTGGWRGNPIGRYEILYADGQVQRVPLVAGSQVADWRRPVESQQAAVGWETASTDRETAGLMLLPVVLQRPGRVRAVRAVAEGKHGLVLVAATVADGPAVLTRRPLRYEFNATAGWYPFNFPLDDTNLDTIDLTRLLDGPAGKHGFLQVGRDGHFYFRDGTRGRFFGTNICGGATAPPADEGRATAARLAKYGVNLLRIHAIDSRWGPVIDYARGNSRHLDPAAMDRLDRFFAELKQRGIYVYFDLLDYRDFQPGDEVRDAAQLRHGWEDSIKGASCFNERMIELQQEFATQFLTHRNPYTGLRYVDDPAVAVVETTNENSVFYFTNMKLTLPCYVEELRGRWNAWLVERYGDRARLAAAWTNPAGRCGLLADEDPRAGSVFLPMAFLYQRPEEAEFVGQRSPVRVNATARFFFDLERSYYERMHKHLKTIGVKVPITGTNQTFCPASVYADSVADFMSRNNYWQHPNVHAQPFFTFHNRAMLASDLATTSNPVTEVASSTAAGKPMIVPEFNFPWPNEFRAEGLLLMTAYGCLQDWDGLLFFAYSPGHKTLEWFGNQSDPVRWGEFAAAALMFHRGDVSPARNTVHVGYSEADTFTAGPSHGRARQSPFHYLPYISKVRSSFFQKTYRGDADVVVASGTTPTSDYSQARRVVVPKKADAAASDPVADYRQFAEAARRWGLLKFDDFRGLEKKYTSDTGQLSLDCGRGLFRVDTPRSQGAVGKLAEAGAIELPAVSIRSTAPFAAVLVTSLDDVPLAQSRRVLVTAVARAENTGQAFTNGKRSVPSRGALPVLAEPVAGRLQLSLAGRVTAYALDPTGKRGPAVAVRRVGPHVEIDLETLRSPWCEVIRQE